MKSAKNYETILPFSCCPLVFPWFSQGLGGEKTFREVPVRDFWAAWEGLKHFRTRSDRFSDPVSLFQIIFRIDLKLFRGQFRSTGRLIFIHHQCWGVLPFLTIQRQRRIKILCPKDVPRILCTAGAELSKKRQHPPAPEVYKNQSPIYRRVAVNNGVTPVTPRRYAKASNLRLRVVFSGGGVRIFRT